MMNKGGRPKKENKRSQQLAVMCTIAEKKTIKDKAKISNISISQFLRELALQGQVDRKIKVLPKEILLFTATLNHLAANINQMAKKRNQHDELNAIERAELMVMSNEPASRNSPQNSLRRVPTRNNFQNRFCNSKQWEKAQPYMESQTCPNGYFGTSGTTRLNGRRNTLTIMARVLERGTKEEWQEMIRFYGEAKVIQALKKQIKFLADYTIEDVCVYFPLRKEELLYYTRKQSRPGYWI